MGLGCSLTARMNVAATCGTSLVRGSDARSAQIGRRAGVTRSFQVSEYNVEPRKAVITRNLFSKDDWRAALGDEAKPGGPKMSSVIEATTPPC